MQINSISRLIDSRSGVSVRSWARSAPYRLVLPFLVWAAAASAGGLFVYGCSSPNANETSNFNLEVNVTGLASGASLEVENYNDARSYTVIGNGTTRLDTINNMDIYDIEVTGEPPNATGHSGSQYCYVSGGGTGTVMSADVTASITCGPVSTTYTVSGTVMGLSSGNNVALLINGSNPNNVAGTASASVPFDFNGANANALPTGALYNITVQTQPSNQYCYVSSGGGGTIANLPVTNVVVTCGGAVTAPAIVSGNVINLSGGGLVLQNNGGDNLSVAAPAAPSSGSQTPFSFAVGLPASAPYNVTVLQQPAGQYCYPSAAAGGIISSGDAAVTTVAVTCIDSPVGSPASTYAVTGPVTGLTTVGLILQDNGGDSLSVPADPNPATYVFEAQLPIAVTHTVTVLQQPTGQTCSVTNPTGGQSSSATINCAAGNPVPTLTSISPNSAVAASGAADFTLTAVGTSFVNGASTIDWNGTAVTTTFVSSTELTATIPGGDIAAVDTFPVTVVTLPAGGLGGGTSNAINFDVTASNPPPSIASFSPSSAIRGGAGFTLTINGSGFISSTTVTFGGAALTPTLISATQLTVAVPAAGIATAGSLSVVLTNPAPGGGTAMQNYSVNAENPVPTIATLSPTNVAAGSPAITLTVNGTGFFHTSNTNQSAVQWNGTSLPTTYVSDTQLTAVVPSSDLSAPATEQVTVINPTPGGGTSNNQTFTITSATTAPTILGVLTNVASMSSSAITSTITLYNLASSTSTPTLIGTLNNPGNVQSIAIDAANNVYFIANPQGAIGSSFYSCPAPAANASYVCGTNPLGTPGALPQGAWLAVDAHGNAYATQISQATGVGGTVVGASVVRFPVTGPNPGTTTGNMTVVYTSAGGNATTFYGLAVTSDGTSALYVSEGLANTFNGFDVTMHTCGIPCSSNGGNDITTTLVNMTTGSLFGIGGAVAVGPNNAVYFGLAFNNAGASAQPNNVTVALNCTSTGSGATLTLTCKSGNDLIPLLTSNGLPSQAYTNTVGIAADPSGDTYVGILLEPPFGQSFTAPAPATFLGFLPPSGAANQLISFSVTGPAGPTIGASDYDAPNYQIAITQSP
jgi:hypothetical protein